MTRRRDGNGGFVLVEALATLAISALVLAGAVSLVSLMLRAADRTAMSVETLETAGRAIAAVERDILAAVRVHRLVDGRQTLVFSGGPDSLMVVIDRLDRNDMVVPVMVRWHSETTGAGRGRLIRSETPIVPGVDLPTDERPAGASIDTGPALIRFAYFAPAEDGGGEVLTDDWEPTQTMPTAVRIGRADPGSEQVSTSVRVPFRVEAELGCAVPAMGYCSLTPNRPAGQPDGADPLAPPAGAPVLPRRDDPARPRR